MGNYEMPGQVLADTLGGIVQRNQKRHDEGKSKLRDIKADELESAIKNIQAKGALQPNQPGYLSPKDLQFQLSEAQKQLSALYEPHEAPDLLKRLKRAHGQEAALPGETSTVQLKPGMTLNDVLSAGGPVPQPQDPGKIITPKPFKGQDDKWYVVRQDEQGNLKQQEMPGYSEESEMQEYVDAGLSPEDAKKALRINHGLDAKAAAPKETEKEKDVSDWLESRGLEDTPGNREKARTAIAKRGKVEPGSMMPLYDQRPGHEGEITGAWDAKSGRQVKAPKMDGTTAAGAGIATRAATAKDKKIAPLEAIVEEADLAPTLKQQADAGNAEADVALVLNFFKVMRGNAGGAGGGAGGGIRFTQQEQNLIFNARSMMGGLEVKSNKVFSNGEPLSSDQRQQMVSVIQNYKQAAQRKLDELKGGGGDTTVDDVAKGLTAE